jgi:nucleoid-associated protein YgaU
MNKPYTQSCIWSTLLLGILVSGCAGDPVASDPNTSLMQNPPAATQVTVSKEKSTEMDAAAPEGQSPKMIGTAKQMHTKNEAVHAIEEANRAISRAVKIDGLWRDTEKYLKNAEMALAGGDFSLAYELAAVAKDQAESGINQAYLELAKHMVERVKHSEDSTNTHMLAKIASAESAYLRNDGSEAYTIATGLMAEVAAADKRMVNRTIAQRSKPEKELVKETPQDKEPIKHDTTAKQMELVPARMIKASMSPPIVPIQTPGPEVKLPDRYQVLAGDSLWNISGKPKIYNNPYQWPLIFKANRRKISDPDLIQPGQILTIERSAPEVEIKAAIAHAKTRGAWSVGILEDLDKAYLIQSDVASR